MIFRTITPVAKEPDTDSETMSRLQCVVFFFMFTVAAIGLVAEIVFTQVIGPHNYENYMRDTHPVDATIVSISPDERYEALTLGGGNGPSVVTRRADSRDTVGQAVTVRVFSDGHYTEEPRNSSSDRVAAGVASFFIILILGCAAAIVF